MSKQKSGFIIACLKCGETEDIEIAIYAQAFEDGDCITSGSIICGKCGNEVEYDHDFRPGKVST